MDPLANFKAAQRAGWALFAPLQATTTMPAAQLVTYAGIRAGQQVLDVACGTGVVSVTAARTGAVVTGLDLTPELLAVARDNARTARVDVAFHEGDVEALPFDASSFDVVVSQFGHMFAPRPAVAIGEMLRVLKRGGTIAFSTWPPRHHVGRMIELTARYLPPPPPGVSPPAEWGDEAVVRERLGGAVRDVAFARGVSVVPTLSAAHYREQIERTAGAVVKLIEMLSGTNPARLDAFRKEHEALTAEYFDDNCLRQEYLMTRASRA